MIMRFLSRFQHTLSICWVALVLGACASAQQFTTEKTLTAILPSASPARLQTGIVTLTLTPSPTLRKRILGPEPTPFLTHTPPPGATPIPTALISQPLTATTRIYSRTIGQSPYSFTLDAEFIYWSGLHDAALYRFPIQGGNDQLLTRSQLDKYGDSYLWAAAVRQSRDWLIFHDSRLNDVGSWALHALNLKTIEDRIVMQEIGSHAPMWSPLPDFSAEGDWLVWARLELGHATRCDQSILGMTNLVTGKERELERVCTADHYIWSIPHLSGEHLIVEQDLPDAQGRQNNIFLWNWKTGERKPLTTNGYSSMPAVSGKWVVWKEAPRYTASKNYIIYNLETGERQSFRGLKCWSDPRVSGHWLYSSVCKNTLTVYDLAQQRWVNVVQLPKGESFRGFGLSDEWAVWGVARETAARKEYEIQWRRLP